MKKPKNFSIKKSVTEVDTHNSVSMIFPKILNSISDTNKYLNDDEKDHFVRDNFLLIRE